MSIPNPTIVVPYVSKLKFRIVEVETGNQVFSASVTGTASASGFDFPDTLGLASKLATAAALKQGPKLVKEYLDSIKIVESSGSCVDYLYCIPLSVEWITEDEVIVSYYTWDRCTFLEFTNPIITTGQCNCCSKNNSQDQLTACQQGITSDLCINSPCASLGCPRACFC